MADLETRLLQERAAALAIVHLTRRDDLQVTKPERDTVFDLLVEIKCNGTQTGRFLGVAVNSLRTGKPVHRITGQPNTFQLEIKPFKIPQDVPFPVCLFVFRMDTDTGYYRWILEPAKQLRGKLHRNQDQVFRLLDRDALDEIIATVNTWYDKRVKIPA